MKRHLPGGHRGLIGPTGAAGRGAEMGRRHSLGKLGHEKPSSQLELGPQAAVAASEEHPPTALLSLCNLLKNE